MITPLLLVASTTPVLAGYADAFEYEVERHDGVVEMQDFPSWAERDMHLWTNAARVDPEAFDADYQSGGCSFDSFLSDEQTPKPPLFFDPDLTRASRWHCEDMVDNNHFAHESSDGTSFGARVARFYTDSSYVGENIAYGYGTGFPTVMVGWMCSDGHRANIMSAGYNEMGPGAIGTHFTQDFGAGTLGTEGKLAMGIHSPENPETEVDFYVDFYDQEGAPDAVRVFVDGEPHVMELEWGAEDMGIYALTLDVTDDYCHQYYFTWRRGNETSTWPEEGSYIYGERCDNPLGWVDTQMSLEVDVSTEGLPRIIGCASAPLGAGITWVLGMLGVARRRSG